MHKIIEQAISIIGKGNQNSLSSKDVVYTATLSNLVNQTQSSEW